MYLKILLKVSCYAGEEEHELTYVVYKVKCSSIIEWVRARVKLRCIHPSWLITQDDLQSKKMDQVGKASVW